MRALSVTLCIAAAGLAAGCSCAELPAFDGLVDGGTVDVLVIDGGVDGGLLDASDVPSDVVAPDAPDDVPADVGCECEVGACEVGACEGAVCIYSPVVDGTPCEDPSGDGVCTAGLCGARGVTCGDGFRRTSGPEREACDDGNTDASDACDAACIPTPFFVTPLAGPVVVPPGPSSAVGIDGRGWAAYVWTATAGPEVWIRLFDAAGVPASEPILVYDDFPLGGSPRPTIAGLASGWVVAWEDQVLDGSAYGIGYSVVSESGAVGRARVANSITTSAQTNPAVAASPDGFVVAWSDLSAGGRVPGPVMLRRFTDTGAPAAPEVLVDTSGSPGAQTSIAINDDGVILLAWLRTGPMFDSPSTVFARRADGAGFIDAAPFVVDAAASSEPSVAVLESGDFAIAWVAQEVDFGGDIRAARIPSAGAVGAPTVETLADAATDETSPSVVGLEGDAFLVAWENGINRGVGMRALPETALPSEALPPLPSAEAALLGQWSFARRPSSAVPPGDRRIWASFGGYERFVSGVGRARAVVGYLFSPE